MAPLSLAIVGVLVVVLDVNVGSFDVLFDPVGYAVVALAAHRLVAVHPAFVRARAVAWVGATTTLLGAFLRHADAGGVVTENPLVILVETLVQARLVVLFCTALEERSTDARVTAPASTLRLALPVAIVITGLLSLAVAFPLSTPDLAITRVAGWGLLLLPLLMITVVLAVWFLRVLRRATPDPRFAGRRTVERVSVS